MPRLALKRAIAGIPPAGVASADQLGGGGGGRGGF